MSFVPSQRSMKYLTLLTFAVFVLIQATTTVLASTVKMSASGLCHPPQSSWYDRTQNYRPFNDLQACLKAGGRLPQGVALGTLEERAEAASSQYQRSAFGRGWDDVDGDCRDSRAEALINASTTPVRFAKERGCRVVTGRWISPFTGEVIQNASNIDIDHVVPLAWAWERGATNWSKAKRERFANDPKNLLPVEASLNRSKGAKGPDEWLPPAGQCGYVARFVRIMKLYGLKPALNESSWYKSFLAGCRQKRVSRR